MPYDNFKSHKKPGFHLLFRRYNFQKTTVRWAEGLSLIPPPPTPQAVLGLNELTVDTLVYRQYYLSIMWEGLKPIASLTKINH